MGMRHTGKDYFGWSGEHQNVNSERDGGEDRDNIEGDISVFVQRKGSNSSEGGRNNSKILQVTVYTRV